MTAHLVYSPGYDLYLPLLEHLHPFDGRKYSRAYRLLQERFGGDLEQVTHVPPIMPGSLIGCVFTRNGIWILSNQPQCSRERWKFPRSLWSPREYASSYRTT